MTETAHQHADQVFDTVRSPRRAAVSPVAASWCRSALHHRLDPASEGKRELLDARAIADKREAHEPLLAVAIPVLDQMFRAVGRSGCGVILSDASGAILDHRVGDGDRDAFAEAGLVTGGRWSEAEEGTNGIGTCLFEDKPVIIHRDQHFASRNIDISCMDAPVHDPHGRLIAALDVSSCRDDHGPAMAEAVAALVRDAARRIERDYFCRHFEGARIIFLGDAPAGWELLAADRDDLVIGASRAARQRLGVTDAMLERPRPVAQLMGGDAAPSFEQADRTILRQALAQAGGNASEAARLLGIGRATLYRRMARAGLRG
ncbi:transcriptional regulator of acetoin/glycerol metabolism [Sphingopyxis panaciterrae]|uniref:GAF domain-containing protein n=1 Tax=Sphingopyxis panaciterrae TaxID=363841 RepID=UPI00141DB263|nr:GAF domain-containing protein [Sphingopyxis panaciterrae]NIJ38590.1 transcriptional regulator of acetoin/glycerol metabolism [Sphingopyxis panaciterrae]